MAQRGGSPPSGSPQQNLARVGEETFRSMNKTSAEFFSMMYGSLVRQLTIDHPGSLGIETINRNLDDVGFSMGMRLIDEYLAKSGQHRACSRFLDTGDAIANVGMKMFIGVTGTVINAADDGYSIVFDDSPLTLFVDLPELYVKGKLHYCNAVCGVIRGALHQVGFTTSVVFAKDRLLGDPRNEIRVTSLRKK